MKKLAIILAVLQRIAESFKDDEPYQPWMDPGKWEKTRRMKW